MSRDRRPSSRRQMEARRVVEPPTRGEDKARRVGAPPTRGEDEARRVNLPPTCSEAGASPSPRAAGRNDRPGGGVCR